VLTELIPISHYEVRILDFAILAENCPDFKTVVTFWFDVLLYNERFVFYLDHLVQEIFKIVTVNNVSFASCLVLRQRLQKCYQIQSLNLISHRIERLPNKFTNNRSSINFHPANLKTPINSECLQPKVWNPRHIIKN
jgi:hypothetical protein